MRVVGLISLIAASLLVVVVASASASVFDARQAAWGPPPRGDPPPFEPGRIATVNLAQSAQLIDCTALNFSGVVPHAMAERLMREVEERSPSARDGSDWEQELRGVIETNTRGELSSLHAS